MFAKSFDSITKGLQRMIEDLRAHAENKTAECRSLDNRADELRDMATLAEGEASKSMETANKLAKLLGD